MKDRTLEQQLPNFNSPTKPVTENESKMLYGLLILGIAKVGLHQTESQLKLKQVNF